MAASIGGGLYEKLVLIPLWSASPPSSFSVIQPGTGVPLQNFWIPVHIAITICVLLALVLNWKEPKVRRLVLIGLGSYIVMRVWSGFYFIPEMLAFQKIPLDSAPSAELSARVASWTVLPPSTVSNLPLFSSGNITYARFYTQLKAATGKIALIILLVKT